MTKLQERLKVVIYNRCSTEEAEQVDALERQVQFSRDYCLEHGWEIVQQYIEPKSGTESAHRYEFQKLRNSMYEMEYDMIVVKSQERLMRNDLDWNLFVRDLIRTGKGLYFYIDHKLYDHDRDNLVYSFTSKFNELHSVELSKKIKDAHKKRQQKHLGLNICREMFGWDKRATNEYVINEREASYIKEAFELVRGGMGFYRLANYMYERGVRSKGTSGTRSLEPGRISATWWRNNCIMDPRMHGTIVMNTDSKNFWTKKRSRVNEEEWIYYENALPAIVSREYQEETIQILKERSAVIPGKNRRIPQKYLYSNKLKCAECGTYFSRREIRKKGGNESHYVFWKCRQQVIQGCKGCDNITIEENALEELLIKTCRKIYKELFCEQIYSGICRKVYQIIKKVLVRNDLEEKKEKLLRELKSNQYKKDVLFQKLMEQIITDEEFTKYNKLVTSDIMAIESEIKVLQRQKQAYNEYEERLVQIKKILTDRRIMIESITLELQKSIREIEVHKTGDLTVYFHSSRIEMLYAAFGIKAAPQEAPFLIQYHRDTVYEKDRREMNEKVLKAFKENPSMTIRQCAELLDRTYSYVYTSVTMLREMGLLEYNKEDCSKNRIWMVHGL